MLFMNPYDKPTHERLARIAGKLKEHDLTIREYEWLLKFPDTNAKIAYLELARAHLGKGNVTQAKTYARKLLELDAGNADAQEIIKEAGSP
jgi:hypothetical protein